MSSFNECLVLIPSSTLEDFPSDASASDARELLAAWTVLWHPSLVAATGQNPTWYRADSPPEPQTGRLFAVPTLSRPRLPEGFELKCHGIDGCVWLSGNNRSEMLASLDLDPLPPLVKDGRTLGIEDFFAFGYLFLQVQIMTRRLRYTSNLDEIYVQKRIVAAANAFLAQDAELAIDSLHEAFDALAEERDHYFSTDPSLVDLTLLTPGTVANLELPPTSETASHSVGVLPTPRNVLMDAEVLAFLSQQETSSPLLEAVRAKQLGFATGGPPAEVCFDTLSFRDCEQSLLSAQNAASALGIRPMVYGRLSGSTPSDLTRVLVSLGYRGMIPIDFTGGSGFGDESKVIRREAGAELEALTARPIDANNDAAFLALAPRLGEMIDSGEIATGLLAHWPGESCDSYLDLRRIASWSLALGKFWMLDAYFTEGEHPYHHSSGKAQCSEAADRLTARIAAQQTDPLSRVVAGTQSSILAHRDQVLRGVLSIASGKPIPVDATVSDLAKHLGVCTTSNGSRETPSSAVLVLNPWSAAQRHVVSLRSTAYADEHVFSHAIEKGRDVVSLDIPACGFAIARTAASMANAKLNVGDQSSGAKATGWLQSVFRGKSKRIADGMLLQNEFMEATIDVKSGGIQGVYSGSTRGNRLSMRLVCGDQETSIRCDKVFVSQCTPSVGIIQSSGAIISLDGTPLANFTLTYALARGGRLIRVDGEVTPLVPQGPDPWKNYIATRVAFSEDTGTTRAILRDKLHRTSSRRIVAPLGLVIEEAERQTLIASSGLAFHRRVQDRFIDTLVMVAGESVHRFSLQYGFDVSQPLEIAKSVIAPPVVLPIESDSKISPRGWLLHVAPKDTSLIDVATRLRNDGRLAARVRLVRTRSTGGTTTIRFCRNLRWVTTLLPEDGNMHKATGESDQIWNQDDTDETTTANKKLGLSFDADTVKVPLSGHQILDLLVVLE